MNIEGLNLRNFTNWDKTETKPGLIIHRKVFIMSSKPTQILLIFVISS